MVMQFNSKYKRAVKDSKSCISFVESLNRKKIPNDLDMLCYYSSEIHNSVGIEYPDNHFNSNNLLNSNYNDLTARDFETYYYLAKLSGYQDSGKEMLKVLLQDGYIDYPVLIKGKNNIYYQMMGNLQMMAYKVLGISPICKEIIINVNITP